MTIISKDVVFNFFHTGKWSIICFVVIVIVVQVLSCVWLFYSFLCPWDFPGKNTGEGCHFLLQGIFLIQWLNLPFLHRQVDSLPLIHQGSPRTRVFLIKKKTNQRHCCCCCCYVASVVSDSVRPHRRQPTRLRHPWDSPGKNTGVGCHFLLQCMKVKSGSKVTQSCPTLSYPMDCSPPGSSVHGIFPGKSAGVGCQCLLHQRHWIW